MSPDLDIYTILTPEVKEAIRLFALVAALMHVLVALILLRNVFRASNVLTTRKSGLIKVVTIVHILFLTAILLLIIFYNQLPG